MRTQSALILSLLLGLSLAASETVAPDFRLKFTIPPTLIQRGWTPGPKDTAGYHLELVGEGKATFVGLVVFASHKNVEAAHLNERDYLSALKVSNFAFSIAPGIMLDSKMITFLGRPCLRARLQPIDMKAGPHVRATELVFYADGFWYVLVMNTSGPGSYWPEENERIKPFLDSMQLISSTEMPNQTSQPSPGRG
jgi:hypothetical protein